MKAKQLAYPADIEQDEGGRYVVTFPDLPYGATDGEDLEDALFEAQDCLDEVIAGLIADGQELPSASKTANGQYLIPVSGEVVAKYAINEAFKSSGWTKVEVAKKLHANEKAVRRLLDPRERTKPRTMNAALRIFGKRLITKVEDVA